MRFSHKKYSVSTRRTWDSCPQYLNSWRSLKEDIFFHWFFLWDRVEFAVGDQNIVEKPWATVSDVLWTPLIISPTLLSENRWKLNESDSKVGNQKFQKQTRTFSSKDSSMFWLESLIVCLKDCYNGFQNKFKMLIRFQSQFPNIWNTNSNAFDLKVPII